MAIDQKAQAFQILKQFIAAKPANDPVYAEIAEELGKIGALLNNRRLTLAVFSQFPLLAEALSNVFNRYQALSQFYEIIVKDLEFSHAATSNSTPTLTLKANSQVGQSEAQYKLSFNQNILIGRDLQYQNDSTLVQIPLPMYKKVSGRHAEIHPVSSISSSVQSWQICDLNSTNGTYINGQKIKGCQVLQPGDRITLAYPTASKKAPEFTFEGQNISLSDNADSHQIDTDFIFLVIHPTQPLSTSEKQLVDRASKTEISGLVIIADISGTKLEDVPKITKNLTAVQEWGEKNYPQLADNLDIVELPLYPFYPNTPSKPLEPAIEQRFVEFATPFIKLAKERGVELLANQISKKIQTQIQRIDQILTAQEKALSNETQRTATSLNGRTLEYWRDHYNQVKRQVEECRDDFFREARNHFFRARDDFATEFIPDNLLQRIDTFVNSLEPRVTKLDGQVCIQLQASNGQDLHVAMINFCQAELTQWGNRQWEQICHTIGGHGLEGFVTQSYNQLNCFPEFQLTNTFSSPSVQPNFTHHFKTSFSEVKADIAYNESSGDAFGGIAKIAMLTTQTAISASMISPFAVIQGASAISALGSFVGSSLSRPQQEELRLAQVVDSLRRNTCTHYRNIARYLLSRVAQEIGSAIEAEDRRLRKARDITDEQVRRYLMELENISRGYKMRQETLKKDRATFDQIKYLVR
jgi:hypothetical protein